MEFEHETSTRATCQRSSSCMVEIVMAARDTDALKLVSACARRHRMHGPFGILLCKVALFDAQSTIYKQIPNSQTMCTHHEQTEPRGSRVWVVRASGAVGEPTCKSECVMGSGGADGRAGNEAEARGWKCHACMWCGRHGHGNALPVQGRALYPVSCSVRFGGVLVLRTCVSCSMREPMLATWS